MASILHDSTGVPSHVQLSASECAYVLAEMELDGEDGNAERRRVMASLERVARYALADIGHPLNSVTRGLAADMSGGPDIAKALDTVGVMEAAEIMRKSERHARRVLVRIGHKDERGRWVAARCDFEQELAGHG